MIPGPHRNWELWSGTAGSREEIEDPGLLNGQALHFALPAGHCRSFPLFLPSKDRKLFPDMIHAQLEKRGFLAKSKTASPARFGYEILEKQPEGTLLRVDLVSRELPESWTAKNALTMAPAQQFFHYPSKCLVLMQEFGRLIVVVNREGKLLYSGILSQDGRIHEGTAQELRALTLSLQSEGFIQAVQRVELWGEFAHEEVQRLQEGLSIPVTITTPRPAPDQNLRPRSKTASIRVGADRPERTKRNKRFVWLGVAVALLAAYLGVLYHLKQRLEDMRSRVSSVEESTVETKENVVTADDSSKRWHAFRDAIDTQRYPLVQLNQIALIMPPDGVILRRFETKLTEVKIQGTANRAKAVFDFLDQLNGDPELSAVYSWSRKEEPRIDDDGSATFELIGKQK